MSCRRMAFRCALAGVLVALAAAPGLGEPGPYPYLRWHGIAPDHDAFTADVSQIVFSGWVQTNELWSNDYVVHMANLCVEGMVSDDGWETFESVGTVLYQPGAIWGGLQWTWQPEVMTQPSMDAYLQLLTVRRVGPVVPGTYWLYMNNDSGAGIYGGGENDNVFGFSVALSGVPEPSCALVLLCALGGLARLTRRR